MQRLLSTHENTLLAIGARVLVCCDIQGPIDHGKLTQAVRTLVRYHPILAGRFCLTDDGYAISAAGNPLSIEIGICASLEGETSVMPDWMAGPLLRVSLIKTGTTTTVVMNLPRALADGMSFIALQRRMWQIYTDLLQGEMISAKPIEPVPPPSLEQRAHEALSSESIRSFLREQRNINPATYAVFPAVTPPAERAANFAVRCVELTQEATRRFVDTAHRNNLTVHELSCGIVLTAAGELLASGVESVTLHCLSAVDMRRRLNPPIPNEVLQSAASTSTAIINVASVDEPVRVGQKVSTTLRRDLADNKPCLELIDDIASVLSQESPLTPTLIITNLHIIDALPLPAELTTSNWSLLPLADIPVPVVAVSRSGDQLRAHLCFSRNYYDETLMEKFATAIFNRFHQVLGFPEERGAVGSVTPVVSRLG